MLDRARSQPIAVTYLFIAFIILLNRIPINQSFEALNFSIKASASLENIISNTIVTGICFWLIIKFKFIDFLKLDRFETKHLLYFLPLLFYIVFIGDSSGFFNMDKEILYSPDIFYTFFEKLTSAFLEEIVFRGLVLALLINKYIESRNGILIGVLLASFIFGTTHFINVITQPERFSAEGVTKQVFIATCLGVMFSAMFLKSRNIFILIISHFMFNIFSILDDLKRNAANAATRVIEDKTTFEIIASLILFLLIFGIPLLIGIAILKHIDIKQIKSELKLI